MQAEQREALARDKAAAAENAAEQAAAAERQLQQMEAQGRLADAAAAAVQADRSALCMRTVVSAARACWAADRLCQAALQLHFRTRPKSSRALSSLSATSLFSTRLEGSQNSMSVAFACTSC